MPKEFQEKAVGRNIPIYPSESAALEGLRKKWKLKSVMDVIRALVIQSDKTGAAKDAFYLPRQAK